MFYKGLIEIENQKAETISLGFKEILKRFGIESAKKLFITSDGANNMGAFIRKVNGIQQQCMAHGINLVLNECIYKPASKVFKKAVETVKTSLTVESEGLIAENDVVQSFPDAEDPEATTDTDSENEVSNQELFFEIKDTDSDVFDVQKQYVDAIKKLRNIVRKLRGSNIFINALRKYTPLKPILDVVTRWSSLDQMCVRFIQIWGAIKKVAIDHSDLKKVVSEFTDDDQSKIIKLNETLIPLKEATNSLSKSDLTLIDAENILNNCYNSLTDSTVKEVFKEKMKARRTILSDIFCFLTSSTSSIFYVEPDDDAITNLYNNLFDTFPPIQPSGNHFRLYIWLEKKETKHQS